MPAPNPATVAAPQIPSSATGQMQPQSVPQALASAPIHAKQITTFISRHKDLNIKLTPSSVYGGDENYGAKGVVLNTKVGATAWIAHKNDELMKRRAIYMQVDFPERSMWCSDQWCLMLCSLRC